MGRVENHGSNYFCHFDPYSDVTEHCRELVLGLCAGRDSSQCRYPRPHCPAPPNPWPLDSTSPAATVSPNIWQPGHNKLAGTHPTPSLHFTPLHCSQQIRVDLKICWHHHRPITFVCSDKISSFKMKSIHRYVISAWNQTFDKRWSSLIKNWISPYPLPARKFSVSHYRYLWWSVIYSCRIWEI